MSEAFSAASGDSMKDSNEQATDTSSSASQTPTGETCSEHGSPESPSTRTYGESLMENMRGELTLSPVARSISKQGGKPGQGYQAVLISSAEAWHENQNGELSCQGEIAATLGAERSHNYQWISSAEDSPVKTSASPDDAPDSPETGPACSSSSPESQTLFDPAGFSSRTYPVSSLATAVGTSESCLERWPTSGTAWRGGFSTHVSSECRSADGECSSLEPSLTEILEPPLSVPARYSLSARAASGILRRAEKRGRTLPVHLMSALRSVAILEEQGKDTTPIMSPEL